MVTYKLRENDLTLRVRNALMLEEPTKSQSHIAATSKGVLGKGFPLIMEICQELSS